MSINIAPPPSAFTKILVGGSSAITPSPTQVNGVNVAAAVEIQSTDGGFLPPRMTGAQMNALVPVVPGIQVFVTDAVTVPSGTYIRQSDNTWKIVDVSVSDETAVTVAQDDSKPDGAVPVWKTDGVPEVESTDIRINAGNIISGLYTLSTVSTDSEPTPLPDGSPIYGMNFDRNPATEGIGTPVSGVMTLWANGVVQARVIQSGDGTNQLDLAGSSSLGPVGLHASGGDADISIVAVPKGNGQFLNSAAGTQAKPGYAFNIDQGTGLFNPTIGTLSLAANGKIQASVSNGNSSDGSNYLEFRGNSGGSPVWIHPTGSDSDVNLLIRNKGLGSVTIAAENSQNFLSLYSSTTGNPVQISASGSDTNVSLSLVTKGNGNVLINSGTQSLPGLAFNGDPDTGMYRFGANSMGFCIGGNGLLFMQGSQVLTTDGSAVSPVYSFLNNNRIGFYSGQAGMIGIATAAPVPSVTSITISIPVEVNGTTYYLKASVAA